MTDTSASALLKLAARLAADDDPDGIIAADPDAVDKFLASTDTLFSDIDRTLRALAAERTAAAPDVVERVARALLDVYYHRFTAQNPDTEVRLDAWWSTCRQDLVDDAAAALAALRPGDEVPAGVVVPREMTEEMIEAASHAGLSARDLIRDKHPHRRGFADAEWLPASWRAALSAIKGGEDE